jgi:centromere-localized protein 2
MSSQEFNLLKNFLLAPAALRDFLTLQQFTEIFPPAQRSSPAVRELYVEISRLRQQDIEDVRQNITDEVKRSKQLRRDYARERRHRDDANVAGLDLVALQMEEEVN